MHSPTRREGLYSFDFTDWTALKTLHGGADITSASPLEERQRLVLDMVRSEASGSRFGLDRLATWPELWGWDNTDLAWEATPWDPRSESTKVLRFRDGWDSGPFIDRLEALGYSRTDDRYGSLFSDPPDFRPSPGGEAVLDADELLLAAPSSPSVAISNDGRTVAIREGDRADKLLRIAARADPATFAASPFGRAAAALGRPVSAIIVDGTPGCHWAGLADIDYSEEMTTLARSVGPLHPYQALAMGYERSGAGEPVMGRYAFAYKRARQAVADLPGRRTLIDGGYSSRHGKPYREAAFTLADAQVDGRTLVLKVAPLYDNPKVFLELLNGRSLSFATCGSPAPIGIR